jgi:hypothetical protein
MTQQGIGVERYWTNDFSKFISGIGLTGRGFLGSPDLWYKHQRQVSSQ